MKCKKAITFLLTVVVLLGSTSFMGSAEEKFDSNGRYIGDLEVLTIMTNGPVLPDQNPTKLWMEEQLGFKLDFQIINDNEINTKLTLSAVGETLPDLVTLPSHYSDTFSDLVESRQLVELDPLIDQYGPNIKKYRTQEQLDVLRSDDGKLYAINNTIATVYDMILIRKDWLDKLGLPIPKTLGDWEVVFEKFITEDPAGHGMKMQGYVTQGRLGLGPFFAAFGSRPFGWIIKDNKLVSGATQPETLEAIKYLHTMVEKGYLSPEYLTTSYEKLNQYVNTQVTGVAYTELWFARDDYTVFNPDGNANWIGVEPPMGPNGDQGYLTSANPHVRQYTMITKNCKDPAAAMAYINFIADMDNYTRIRAGIEGVHYELDENGLPHAIGKYAIEGALVEDGIGFTYVFLFMPEDPDPPALFRGQKEMDALRIRREFERDYYYAYYWGVDNPRQLGAGWDSAFWERVADMIINGGDIDDKFSKAVKEAYGKYRLADLEVLITENYIHRYGEISN